jgi:A/G-specific adenine glycosylase
VWISEVMLQQTQVMTVLDYWPRFIQRFPQVADLAAADLSEVLRLWEGLGYYRRARQLHAAAIQIVEHHGGHFPTRYDQVLALPGVGRYTAGAVLSIALGQALPILEGNTIRLYSRLLGLRTDPTTTANQKLLWKFAETLVPRCRPGQFNQGLMEIGGIVCRTTQPACRTCPLKQQCATFRQGWQAEIPAEKVRKTRWESRIECVVLLHWQGKLLGRIMPEGQRWAGLWDFPRFDIGWLLEEGSPATAERLPDRVLQWLRQELKSEFGLKVRLQPRPGTIRHGVTRFRIQLACAEGQIETGCLNPRATQAGWQWQTVADLVNHPLNVTARQVLSSL